MVNKRGYSHQFRPFAVVIYVLAGKYVDLSSVIFGYDYWGKTLPLLQQYWAGGYMSYLSKDDKATANSKITSLKGSNWLERGTRILLIGKLEFETPNWKTPLCNYFQHYP